MASRERVFTWYVHPRDSHTNEVLSKMGSRCEFVGEVKCSDKTVRQL